MSIQAIERMHQRAEAELQTRQVRIAVELLPQSNGACQFRVTLRGKVTVGIAPNIRVAWSRAESLILLAHQQ